MTSHRRNEFLQFAGSLPLIRIACWFVLTGEVLTLSEPSLGSVGMAVRMEFFHTLRLDTKFMPGLQSAEPPALTALHYGISSRQWDEVVTVRTIASGLGLYW
jgi:hypothetical protein